MYNLKPTQKFQFESYFGTIFRQTTDGPHVSILFFFFLSPLASFSIYKVVLPRYWFNLTTGQNGETNEAKQGSGLFACQKLYNTHRKISGIIQFRHFISTQNSIHVLFLPSQGVTETGLLVYWLKGFGQWILEDW